MSLEEKVGQTIFPAIPADLSAREFARRAIRDLHVGGFLLQRGGLLDAQSLLRDLRISQQIPLIIASDMERGVGDQLAGATSFPANLALGAAADEGLARLQGEVAGAEARAVGVNLILGPVLDLHGGEDGRIVGTRAYAGDPEVVSRLGAAFIRGCASRGIGSCAKHFPGHGGTLEDSHATLPVISKGLDDLRSQELVPFDRAIRAGVDAVMVGHLLLEDLDTVPASLSPKVIRSLLREEMGFQGLVLTDALLMGALTRTRSEPRAAAEALAAGADILLCPTEPGSIHAFLTGAVSRGEIPEAVLDAAVCRQLRLKERRGLLGEGGPPPKDGDGGGWEEILHAGAEAARSAAEASICLLRNEGEILPLREKGQTLILVVGDRPDPWSGRAFIDAVAGRLPVTVVHLRGPPEEGLREERERIQALCRDSNVVIWVAAGRPRAWTTPSFQEGPGMDLGGERSIAVALGGPALLGRAPAFAAALLSFSDADVSQVAAARAVFGEIPFRGRLPLDCRAGRRGAGLT